MAWIDSGIAALDRQIAEMPLGAFQETFSMQDQGHQIVIQAPDLFAVAASSDRAEQHLEAIVHGEARPTLVLAAGRRRDRPGMVRR